MAALTLNAVEVHVPPERAAYNRIRLKYQRLAEEAASGFSASYAETFKNIDDIHNKCTDQVIAMLRDAMEVAVQDVVTQGIYDIDLELFANYLGQYVTWEDDFAVVDDRYMAIVLKAEELDAYRTQRRESRGRWVGGGFGLSGAVKGAMQAGALNVATGAVHGLFNLTAKGITAVGDAIKKNELYSAPSTKATLVDAVYRTIFAVHLGLIDAINDKKPGTITGAVTAEDQEKATRLVQNVEANRLPQDSIQQVLHEALSLDPYNERIYTLWLKNFGDRTGELDTVEGFFGMSVSARAKQDLIDARKATLDFSTAEACDASLAALTAYAESINYRDLDKERTAVNAIKDAHEQAKRTHAGTVYPTIEAAEAAKDEEARTVRGVTYDTHDRAAKARSEKTVGIAFYLALFFFPYVTAFFTLRKGYSINVRVLSFGWLAATVAFVMISQP